MSTLSIEFMGPEFVLLLVAWWLVAMVVALAVAGLRRAVARRARLEVAVTDGSRMFR